MTTIIGVLMIVPFILSIGAGLAKDELNLINENK